MRLLPEPVGDQQQRMRRAVTLARSKNPKPVLASDPSASNNSFRNFELPKANLL
jgi:hypothetical protein